MAEAVAAFDSPKIRVPRSILAVIRSVIRLRKATSALYARVTRDELSAQRSTANAGHRHFISILENVLSILQPAKTDESQYTGVTNLFEALAIQDVEGGGGVPAESPAAKPSKQASTTTYELEVDGDEEVFAIMSFFKDLADIREYIREV